MRHPLTPFRQRPTAITALCLTTLILGSTSGCVESQHHGALLGAVVGAGVGYVIASESNSHHRSRPHHETTYFESTYERSDSLSRHHHHDIHCD
ncbi:MAG: hypothetical protein V3V20_10860 [Algisphaera sp.]